MSKKSHVCSAKWVSTFALGISWCLVSCGGGSSYPTPSPTILQSIAVTPANATVAAGLTQQYTAMAIYSDGSSKMATNLTWATSDVTLATVDATGLVTSVKEGAVTVTATSNAMRGNATLTVGPAKLLALSVSPQNATVAAGFTQQFTATGSYSDGSSKTVSPVTWTSSDTTIATMNAVGVATTLKQGMITVAATSGSITSSGPLTVGPAVPVGFNIVPGNAKVLIGSSSPTKLSAILTFSDHSTTDLSNAATWNNTNSFTASIDSSGNVTPLRTGYTEISATSGTYAANTGFTVIAEPRYLYFSSAEGDLVSKAVIDSSSGQPQMTGYIASGLIDAIGAYHNSVFPCPTTDPLNQFLYVETATGDNSGNIVGGELQAYRIDTVSGALNPVSGSPFFTAPGGCVDFEPTGKYGYATININNATLLVTYSRDPATGILTLQNTSNLSAVPTRGAIDPLGKYLFIAASDDGFITTMGLGFSIDSSTGSLTPLAGSPFSLSKLGGTLTFHPSGNYLYAANSNGQSIDTYAVSRATGALTLTSSIATCINPTPLRFSPDGGFAYTTCSMDVSGNFRPSLESFALAANGSLTHLGSTSTLSLASDVTVDPSGQFLYLSTTAPYILVSTVGNGGVAGPVRSVGTQTNPSMSNVVVGGPSPAKFTAKNAYITSSGDNTLSTYTMNPDGTLTLIQSTSTPPAPTSLSLWPWGNDLVVASQGPTPNMTFYSLSLGTGIPSQSSQEANATTAGGVAIEPSGQFAFGTDSTNGVVYTYKKFDVGWGLVTYLGSPSFILFSAGAGAGPIVIDPSGLLVYVANQNANSISAYRYWGTSPQLFESTGTGGSPFAVGAKPLLMAIDPNESFLYVICGDATLRVFSIDYFTGGQLNAVTSLSLPAQPVGLTVDPTGRFLYAADTKGVSGFAVDAKTGSLTTVSLNAISLANITGIYAEPGGKYLYVCTGAQNVPGAVYSYLINGDGSLTAISPLPVATPILPTSMAFSADIH